MMELRLLFYWIRKICMMLSLSLFQAIEFGELDKPKVKFLRQILSKLLQQTQEEDLVQIFSRRVYKLNNHKHIMF